MRIVPERIYSNENFLIIHLLHTLHTLISRFIPFSFSTFVQKCLSNRIMNISFFTFKYPSDELRRIPKIINLLAQIRRDYMQVYYDVRGFDKCSWLKKVCSGLIKCFRSTIKISVVARESIHCSPNRCGCIAHLLSNEFHKYSPSI